MDIYVVIRSEVRIEDDTTEAALIAGFRFDAQKGLGLQHAVAKNANGSRLFANKQPVHRCAGCGAPLFGSNTKFDSGTGWPSFFEALDEGTVELRRSLSHFMARIEVSCARCGSHLGHVFDDGPAPTGKRYCINSCSLDLDRED